MARSTSTIKMNLVLPNLSYLYPAENRKDARGPKGMRAKARLTLFVAANASGTHLLPQYFI